MLVVVSGLPGTGKSAVAAALAARLDAVHFSVDHIEDALLGAGLPAGWTVGVAAYEAIRAVSEQNLALGRTVVVDAVNDSEPARDTWRRAARATGVAVRFVLLTPPDPDEHRARLAHRSRGLTHVPEPTWDAVEARAAAYAPWPDEPILVDTRADLAVVVEQALAAVALGEIP